MLNLIIKVLLIILFFGAIVMSYYPSLFITKKEDYGNPEKLKKIKQIGTISFVIILIILLIIF